MIKNTTKEKFYNIYHRDNKNKKYYKIIGERNFTYFLILKKINNILKMFPTGAKLDILDLGCGVGAVDFYLAKKGHFVTGIDVSSDAIQICNDFKGQIKLDNLKFIANDIFKVNLDQKFDVVICSEVIEHVEDHKKLLNKIYSILKHEGILFLSTPSINAPLYQLHLLDNFDQRVGHLRRYTEASLKMIVHKSGFSVLQTFRVESFIRNFLFTIPPYGFLIKFIRGYLTPFFHFFDDLLVKLFGESNLILIAQKRERCPKCGKWKK